MYESEAAECPLCMEPFEIDDLNFYPCSCGYQICRFCWHRIRTDENGLCPACRKPYSEDPAIYRPLTQEEISRINKERKQRETQRKQKISESRKHLSNVRVIQKNLLFVVGLSQRLADNELLKRPEYFGKFGKILKIVVNPSTNYAGPQGPSASAYITYSKEEETLRAIQAVNNVHLYGRTIRASLGTTKYCTHYLRNTQCHKADCMYLHEAGDESASFTKEDMQHGKHQLYEKELLENYMKSVQNKRKSCDLDQFPQMLGEEKEVWLDEEAPASGSALPANAAWAGKEIKKDDSDGDGRGQIVSDAVPKLSSVDNHSISSATDIPRSMTIHNNVYKHEDSTPKSSPSSLPKELLEPQFATGWATSDETKDSNPYQDPLDEEPGGTRFQIPTWLDDGLGLNNLRVDIDDDLGFDPFVESNRGLEDFIASSSKQDGDVITSQGLASLNYANTGNWLSEFAVNNLSNTRPHNFLPSSEYSLFGKASSVGGSSFFDVWGNHSMYGGEGMTSVPQKKSDSLANSKEEQNSMMTDQPKDMKSWQDGLRALLPNINISFSASFETNDEAKLARKPNRTDTGEKDKKRSPPGLGLNQPQREQPFTQVKSVKDNNGVDRTQPITAWNSVVSGHQNSASSAKSTSQATAVPNRNNGATSQSTSLSGQLSKTPDTDTSNLGKPLGKANPVFSSSSAQNTKKPMAKVKPLKCVVPSEEFLTPTNAVPPLHSERRSRMNDLDDIDFNDPVPPVRAQPPVQTESVKLCEEYQGQSGSWKKTSKRKKKKKDKVSVREPQPVSSFGNIKPEGGIRVLQPAPKKPETEVKKSILERPQTKEIKEKTQIQIKSAKSKSIERQPGSALQQEDDKMDNIVNKPTFKDAARPRSKSSELKQSAQMDKSEQLLIPVQASQINQQQSRGNNGLRSQTQRAPQPPMADSPPKPVAPIRILKSQPQQTGTTLTATIAQSAVGRLDPSLREMYDRESLGRLAESTKLLLQTVLSETEVIKSNTEQISKDLKAALDKCKEPPISVSDLEKLNCLPLSVLSEELANRQGDCGVIDTSDLEKQVESARREAELLEVRLNDVIRKNMESDIESLRKKGPDSKQRRGVKSTTDKSN